MGTIANLLIKLNVDTKDADRELSSFGGKAKRTLSKGIVPAIATLGVLGMAAKRATDAASDLNESQNAVNVVFGKSSSIIHDFAKVADTQAGLSMRQLNQLVTPLGAAMRNYGMDAESAAKSSVTLAKRAADMASVFNTDVATAMEAIQAGFRGEADPLEQFGINLSAANVKAQALAMGLGDASGAVSDHGMMQARLALFLKQSDKYAGDFVKTSEESANAHRINAAEAENLAAEYGKGLLPVTKMLEKVFASMLGWMADNAKTTQVLVGAVAGLSATIIVVNGAMKAWAVVTAIASAATAVHTRMTAAATTATAAQIIAQSGLNAAMKANTIFILVSALIALVAGLVYAWKHSETFRAVVLAVFDAVKAAASAVAGFFTEKIPAAFKAVLDWTRANWPEIATIISGPFAPLVALATNAFGIRSRFQSAMTSARNWAKARIEDIVGFMRSLPGRVGGLAASAGKAILDGLGRGLSALGSKLVSWIVTPVNAVIRAVNGITSRINSAMSFQVDTHIPGVGKVGFDAPDIGRIPMLANGGIVNGPTLAMIGEAGPEAVVPLGRGGGFGQINVTVVDKTIAGMSPEQKRSLVRQLGPELKLAVGIG